MLTNESSNITALWSKYFLFSQQFALMVTLWLLTTWVPELFAAPPVLLIVGNHMGQAAQFFRVLRTLARRAIAVADLSFRLPTEWKPSLFVPDAALSKRSRALWHVGNYRGIYVLGPGGGLRELSCSKAIYAETEDVLGDWGEESLRIVLLPTNGVPIASEQELDALATEFQSKLQLFRLRCLQRRLQSASIVCPPELAGSTLGRELFAMFAGEPEMLEPLLPLAEQQRQRGVARRSLDPRMVALEAIWGPAHQQESLTTTEVTDRVNVLLRARGEPMELSVKTMGWKLRDLGLSRKRRAGGMVLKFSRPLCAQIHSLVRQSGLLLPAMDGCPDCSMEVIEQQGSV